MFIHSGAGLHGHEYSHNSNTRKPLLARAAFSAPIPRIQPRRISSNQNYIPTTTPSSSATPQGQGRSSLSEAQTLSERDLDTMSEDGRSFADSEGSDKTNGGSLKRRKSSRAGTTYHLAHPAPTLTQKQKLLHIRPKLLLQLQRLSANSRPIPALDIVPASVIVPRLATKFPRMFKGKGDLGVNDVMIVKSEEYDTLNHDSSDIETLDCESLADRDVLAVICQVRGAAGSTEICFKDGSKWFATPSSKGVFEFTYTDPISGDQTIARWVPRAKSKRNSAADATPANTASPSRYLFSILDPKSRRHPVLASMTQADLIIPDSYSTVSTPADRSQSTSTAYHSVLEGTQDYLEDGDNQNRTTHTTDAATKTLIQATAVWVALRQGWCPSFSYYDGSPSFQSKTTTPPSERKRIRSSSVNDYSARGALNDIHSNTPKSSQGSLRGRIVRSGTHIFRGSPSQISPSQFDLNSSLPKRSISTGTAFMERNAARKAGNVTNGMASDSDGETVSLPSSPGITSSGDIGRSLGNRTSSPSTLAVYGSSPASESPPLQPLHRLVPSMLRKSLRSDQQVQRTNRSGIEDQIEFQRPHPSTNREQREGSKSKGWRWKKALDLFRPT